MTSELENGSSEQIESDGAVERVNYEYGLIPDDRLSLLRKAALRAAGDNSRWQAELVDAVERLAEQLSILQDLPRDAADALGGAGLAIDRLTAALTLFSGMSGVAEKLPSEADTAELLWKFRDPEVEIERPRLVDIEQIGMIGLSAAYSAVARPEAKDAIEFGLAALLDRLMPLDLLWALGPAVLDGNARSVKLFTSILERIPELTNPIGPPGPKIPSLLDLIKVIPVVRREWLDRVACMIHSSGQVSSLQPIVDPYVIASITPNFACPGQTITIVGSGFGSQPEKVRFPTLSGAAEGQVTSWSDNGIQVIVPQDATCGDIVLEIPAGQATPCGNRPVNVMKPGSGMSYFDGGIPHILRFTSDAPKFRVDPGATVELDWKVCPSNAGVQLTVTVRNTGIVLVNRSGLPAGGRLSFRVPDVRHLETLDCVLEITAPCPPSVARETINVDILPKSNVKIEGMEVTQGIQRFWRQGISPNSVTTVASKDTIVRVYVSADLGGFNNDEVPGIYGVLHVDGSRLYPINGITPTNPSSASTTHTARKVTAINRNNVDHTLNFRIPAAWCWGTKTLFCYLIVPGPNGTVDQTVGFSMPWTWEEEPAFKVRWVRITDNRDPVNIPPTTPTDAQALETVRRALDLLPYPATDLAAAASFPVYSATRDFTTDKYGAALQVEIDNARAVTEILARYGTVLFDREERWIGLTVPMFRGWGSPKTCVAPIYPTGLINGERRRAAHELGHTLGLCHLHDSSCFKGAGLTAEPTLDDVAFDPHWNQTIAATNHDFMSYTTWDYNWITPHNWDALRGIL